MEDQNHSAETQEDPIVMYLVVRESLNMGMGKVGAQCGHAVGLLDRKWDQIDIEIQGLIDAVYGPSAGLWEDLPQVIKDQIKIWDEWEATSFRKVVLKADDKEWVRVKAEIPESHRIVVVDAGLTEIPSGSETVIGIWPMHKSQRPKILTKLQVLK